MGDWDGCENYVHESLRDRKVWRVVRRGPYGDEYLRSHAMNRASSPESLWQSYKYCTDFTSKEHAEFAAKVIQEPHTSETTSMIFWGPEGRPTPS